MAGNLRACITAVILFLVATAASAADLPAASDAQLNAALRSAKPGDVIRLGPGPFGGGFFTDHLTGAAGRPIRITGPSAERPAVFDAPAGTALQIAGAAYVEVENLYVKRAKVHGLALDDGGKRDFSCHHVTIRHCRIEDVGPAGTACGIKLAGVSDFSISDCTFRAWGDAGDAIDGVGCRKGAVERCTFQRGHGSVAVQFKGGSEDVTIRDCLFDELTDAGVHVGGSTGAPYFRPSPQGFEARRITVERNRFVGGTAAVTFGNADGSLVRRNTIYVPTKWAFRILQENTSPGFTPCRNGQVEDNVIVFKSTQWLEGGVNVGPNTAQETFRFARNAWYCLDNPAKSAPRLPSRETDALIGVDPQFADPAKRDFTPRNAAKFKGKGSTAAAAADKPG